MTTTEKYYKIKSGIEIPSQDTLQVTDSNRPTIRPTLNLNFAQAKVLDPRITFARASTATYYDGKTVTKAEENLLLWSQDFSNAIWTKLLTLGSTTETAPDGTATAAVISNSSNFQTIRRDISVAGDVVFSIAYKKTSGATYFPGLSLQSATSYRSVALNTDTGVATPRDIEPVPAGEFGVVDNGTFWRVWIRHTAIQVIYIYSRVNTNAGAAWTGGNGSQTIWGAQLEGRSTPTAYTPTTTQPITNYIPVLQTAPANVARFEHNPITGESLGLEIEEQRTNLFIRAQDFSDAFWTKTALNLTSNTIIAPDGTLTGSKISTTSGTFPSGLISTGNLAAASSSISVYAKAGEASILQMATYNFGNFQCYFDLTTGVSNSSAGTTGFTRTMTNVGNGWWRCTVSGALTAGGNFIFIPMVVNSGLTPAPIGQGIYIWGAQLEEGTFPTSYIKTEASQVTRAADNASMSGTNFSSWYRADEGSFYAEANTSRPTGGVAIATAYFSNSQGVELLALGNGAQFNAVVNGSYTARTNLGTISPNTTFKIAGGYRFNDFAGSLNGAEVVVDTSGNVPSATQPTTLYIGGYATFPNVSWSLTGTIKKLTYYPARITNAQLQSITS